jgi:arsenate reductase (glutaredoxin)
MKQKQDPLTVYVYGKCSTCQKALLFLKQNNLSFEAKEITQTPPSIFELKEMLKYVKDLKKLFNSSGLLYKGLQLSQKLPLMPLDQALQLLATHGMLVKRPFLLGNDRGLLGFKEQDWSSQLLQF